MPDKKPLFDHTFYPAIAVILAVSALVAVYAFSVWPTDQELSPSSATVIKHKTANTNVATNTNTSTNTNTDVTKDWKTYSNTVFGYTIKYPTDYNTPSEDAGNYYFQKGNISGPIHRIGILILTPENHLALEQYEFTGHSGWYDWAMSGFPQKGSVATMSANKRTEKYGPNTFTVINYDAASSWNGAPFYYLVKGKTVFLIIDSNEVVGNATTVKNMLATLDVEHPVNPYAAWKTYTSSAYAFSFKYPSTWKTNEKLPLGGKGINAVAPNGKTTFSVDVDGPTTDHADAIKTQTEIISGQETNHYTWKNATTGLPDYNEYVFKNYALNGWTKNNTLGLIAVSEQDVVTLRLIMNTFVLIDTTVGWKTYTAPTAGYQFKYPDGLGNAEVEGSGYLGTLGGQKAKDWEANLLVIDTNKETQIMYFYMPVADQVSLKNSIPSSWNDASKYSKSTEMVGDILFDKYVAIGTPENNVKEGYAVTNSNRHFIISLMNDRITLAKSILSTFTVTN